MRPYPTRNEPQPVSTPTSAQIDANLDTNRSKRRHKPMQTSTGIDAEKSKLRENIRQLGKHYEKIISTRHRPTQEAPQQIKPRRWATRIAPQPASEPTSAQIDANLGTKRSKRRPKSMPTPNQIDAEQIEAYKFHKKAIRTS